MEYRELLQVEKPPRYLGGELGSVRKVEAELRFVLAFPDVYEVGMSHLGLQILYGVLNREPWLAAERVYAPWPDLEALLRESGQPLASLESGTPLGEAGILGFTLPYELSASNILNMLELAGIPLAAAERDERWPLVIGGGPGAFNPEPLAEFFDAFLLGDGEEAVLEIASAWREWRQSGAPKPALLERLAAIPGVYVPAFFSVSYLDDGTIAAITPLKEGYATVRRRFLPDLETAAYPTTPVVPLLKAVHDRVSLEIARGCTRGCRFCQAGYIYRPVRERSPERILQLVAETLGNTGYSEISLLSLSAGDYSCIQPLLQGLMARHADNRVAVSLPSLRVGSLGPELVEEIKKVRKTGFTLAPEAGSERLRLVINKGISEEDLLQTAREVYAAGWRVIKLYFMLGLPGETVEDLRGIAELAARVKAEGKKLGGGEVNVAVSTFVPKPHTPFQWEPQPGIAAVRERQELLRDELRRRRLNFKWHDAGMSFLEGVFARGDRRLGAVLREAHRRGARFDGWGEHFHLGRWQEAFAACGLDPAWYLRQRQETETLPWQHLDSGVTLEFLRRERQRSLAEIYTPDCRGGQCSGCGVCDFRGLQPRPTPADWRDPAPPLPAVEVEGSRRLRLQFAKHGKMALLSHLELIALFSRALVRAGVPVRYSKGFHPHPKFSFATALSVGIESLAEYFDLEVAPTTDAATVMAGLNRVLPAGLEILAAAEIDSRSPSLSVIIRGYRYRLEFPAGHGLDLAACATAFLAVESWPLRREKKGRSSEFDLRAELLELAATSDALELVAGRGKPLEFAAAITGLQPEALRQVRVRKLAVVFQEPSAATDDAITV